MGIAPNLTYFARGGGGCFLAGTMIGTPDGDKPIESLNLGDKVISYNEITGEQQVSVIGDIDVLDREAYYTINGIVKATAEHPFYTNRGIVEVKDLTDTHMLVGRYDKELPIRSKELTEASCTVYNLRNVLPNNNYYASNYLVHNKGGGGGHASSSGRSSSTRSSTSSRATSSGPRVGTSRAKAGSTIKTSSGQSIKTSSKTPTNSKYTDSRGVVGDNGYSPRFTNGYVAPAGSVVYYPQHDAFDYLPWVYLFSHDSPQNDKVTTVQPSGKEVVAQPVPEGTDGLAVFNWLLLIIIGAAILSGIVWGVNKVTSRN